MSGGSAPSILTGSDYVREMERRKDRERQKIRRRNAEARSQRARAAGVASGISRRKFAKGRAVPHSRDRELGVAKVYPIRQATRKQHRRLYEACCRHRGVALSERGLETNYRLFRSLMAWYRVGGQDFETTNGQQARAMDKAGRARCARTVQRHRAILAHMGLVRSMHVKRQGALVGHRDSLRICLLPLRTKSFVTPPSGAGGGEPYGLLSPSSLPAIPPPTGGRAETPDKPAEQHSSDEEIGYLPGESFDQMLSRLLHSAEPT